MLLIWATKIIPSEEPCKSYEINSTYFCSHAVLVATV